MLKEESKIIKSILDTHYKDAPKRRSIAIEDEEIVKTKAEETKEYDINVILDKAREVKEDDYEKERNKKLIFLYLFYIYNK